MAVKNYAISREEAERIPDFYSKGKENSLKGFKFVSRTCGFMPVIFYEIVGFEGSFFTMTLEPKELNPLVKSVNIASKAEDMFRIRKAVEWRIGIKLEKNIAERV